MRDPVTVPPVMMLPEAQHRMQAAGSKVACVVDEYGGLAGLLTLEDLAEEVTGELTDEHDPPLPEPIKTSGTDMWRIAGDALIDEVEREINHELLRGDYETISGMLIHHLKDLPELNQQLTIDLPLHPSDLVDDEPTSRRLYARILELERRVPTVVELRVEVIVGDNESQEDTE